MNREAALSSQVSILLAMARVGFASYIAYPAGIFMVFLSYPIIIMMYRYVMQALYANAEKLAGYDLQAMLTYVTVSWLLNTFYMTPTGRTLGARVRDGQVAMDLIKPVNLMMIYFGQSLGRTAFRAVFATLPLLFVFLFITRINAPADGYLPMLIPAVILGYLLNFTMDYIIGLIAFYIGFNMGIRWAIRMIMGIAGGMVIPLAYFPDTIRKFFELFPTQYMFYQPMQIYLGRVSQHDAWIIVLNSLLWVLFLVLFSQIMQWGGQKRLSVSGG
ncbi:ABC-2 family transporter protein [bacterium]|nr:ABC-2 family transporter protein [bacterium]